MFSIQSETVITKKNDDDVNLFSLKIPSLITNNGIQFLSESKEGQTGLLLIYDITNDHHHFTCHNNS